MHGHDWKRISVPAQTLYTLEGRSVPDPDRDRKVLDDPENLTFVLRFLVL